MKKFAVITALCGAMVLMSSCASIFTGMSDQITFNSQPEGAKVQIDRMHVGRTPITIPFKRCLTAPQVQISLDGYESQYVMLQTEFNNIALLDIFLFPTFAVDLVTGAITKYSTLNYEIKLDKKNVKHANQ
ncbi:MAG: PEGA domain-containing protein [Lentisphaeria bacterium]